jgi:hypothetical protein
MPCENMGFRDGGLCFLITTSDRQGLRTPLSSLMGLTLRRHTYSMFKGRP